MSKEPDELDEAIRKAMMDGWLKSLTIPSTNEHPTTKLMIENHVVKELKTLIANRERKARISELEDLLRNSAMGEHADAVVRNRLAQLQKGKS